MIVHTLKVKKLFDDVILPSYAHKGDAGCDLRAYHVVKTISPYREICKDDIQIGKEGFGVNPGHIVVLGTGIKCDFPDGIGGLGFMRSGISINNGVSVINGAGVIEYIYRGEICVPLINHLLVPYVVERGERIAQLVGFEQVEFKIEETDVLSETVRGENGFGSSGIK